MRLKEIRWGYIRLWAMWPVWFALLIVAGLVQVGAKLAGLVYPRARRWDEPPHTEIAELRILKAEENPTTKAGGA